MHLVRLIGAIVLCIGSGIAGRQFESLPLATLSGVICFGSFAIAIREHSELTRPKLHLTNYDDWVEGDHDYQGDE